MPAYNVWNIVTSKYLQVVEAENEEDAMDKVASGDWEFISEGKNYIEIEKEQN